jgi:hypothetical protein
VRRHPALFLHFLPQWETALLLGYATCMATAMKQFLRPHPICSH